MAESFFAFVKVHLGATCAEQGRCAARLYFAHFVETLHEELRNRLGDRMQLAVLDGIGEEIRASGESLEQGLQSVRSQTRSGSAGCCAASRACSRPWATAGSMMLLRTATHLYGIGDTGDKPGVKDEAAVEPKTAEAPVEQPQEAKPLRTDWSDVELTDPVEILSNADALTEAVVAVRYRVRVEGTDAAKDQMPVTTATVTAAGMGAFMPEKMKIEGELVPPGATPETRPIPLSGGGDGDRYYAIDQSTRTVHRDFEYGVMGSQLRPLLNTVLREFHLSGPFRPEIETEGLELVGTKEIGGEPCYEIRVPFDPEGGNEMLWFIGKRDLLPRGRHDFGRNQEGNRAGVLRVLSALEVEPELGDDCFSVTVPEGYTETDQPLP